MRMKPKSNLHVNPHIERAQESRASSELGTELKSDPSFGRMQNFNIQTNDAIPRLQIGAPVNHSIVQTSQQP